MQAYAVGLCRLCWHIPDNRMAMAWSESQHSKRFTLIVHGEHLIIVKQSSFQLMHTMAASNSEEPYSVAAILVSADLNSHYKKRNVAVNLPCSKYSCKFIESCCLAPTCLTEFYGKQLDVSSRKHFYNASEKSIYES